MKNLTLIAILLIAFNAFALTPEAEKGKTAIAACLSCHNAELLPPLAPPFFVVQTRYKKEFDNKENFIQAISDWAKKPTLEKSLMKHPVQKLGLMPPMPLPDEMLAQVGAYLYEQEFEPPCNHWTAVLKKSESAEGYDPDNHHDAMVRMKLNKLCK